MSAIGKEIAYEAKLILETIIHAKLGPKAIKQYF